MNTSFQAVDFTESNLRFVSSVESTVLSTVLCDIFSVEWFEISSHENIELCLFVCEETLLNRGFKQNRA